MATSEAGKGAEQACAAAAAAAAAATDGDDGGERPPRMIRMPQEYVDWVLAQKREATTRAPRTSGLPSPEDQQPRQGGWPLGGMGREEQEVRDEDSSSLEGSG